jgi:hypothetical protein
MQGGMVEQKKKADDGRDNKAGCPGNLKQVSEVSRCRWQHPVMRSPLHSRPGQLVCESILGVGLGCIEWGKGKHGAGWAVAGGNQRLAVVAVNRVWTSWTSMSWWRGEREPNMQ